MGYTNYWQFDLKTLKKHKKRNEEKYQAAIIECQKAVRYIKENIVNLSGYSAHCDIGKYGGINLNGVQSDGHETFVLRESLFDNEEFEFCKTARKEYDIAVKVCLLIMVSAFKDKIDFSFDDDLSSDEMLNALDVYNDLVRKNIISSKFLIEMIEDGEKNIFNFGLENNFPTLSKNTGISKRNPKILIHMAGGCVVDIFTDIDELEVELFDQDENDSDKEWASFKEQIGEIFLNNGKVFTPKLK